MKNRLLPLFFVLGCYAGYSQVGVGTLNPDASAQLEVSSTNKGVLIPRVALTSTTDAITIKNGNVNSLLVFNTATVADIKPGYYYWYVDKWNRIALSGEAGSGAGIAGGDGAPGDKGTQGYPGEGVVVYTDNSTGDVYVQNSNGTWTKINGKNGKDGKVGVAGGNGAPGAAGSAGYPGKDINIYTDTETKTVYIQNPDGTWTPINGKDGVVGVAGGNGVPGKKGEPGYPGKDINIYTDKETNTVYVQNNDGTWTPINGKDGQNGKSAFEIWKELPGNDGKSITEFLDGLKGDKGEVGTASGAGAPGNKGEAGYPGEGINMYVDNTTGDVYVQNPDGTWTKINGKDGEVGTAGGNGAP
ncbi:hypothetical protein RB619_13720, partial [Flavobacterium sp. LHD-80]|nr:hypothetical protein [Flavobacterium sp. LHD-80]